MWVEVWSWNDKCSTDAVQEEGQTDRVYWTGGFEQWGMCIRVARVNWLNELAGSLHLFGSPWLRCDMPLNKVWSDTSNQLLVEVHRDCSSTQTLWSDCSSMQDSQHLFPSWWPTDVHLRPSNGNHTGWCRNSLLSGFTILLLSCPGQDCEGHGVKEKEKK